MKHTQLMYIIMCVQVVLTGWSFSQCWLLLPAAGVLSLRLQVYTVRHDSENNVRSWQAAFLLHSFSLLLHGCVHI